jgi:NAD kinase
VLEKGRVVRVNIGSLEQREAWLSADGLDSIILNTDDIVMVKKSEKEAKIIKLKNGGFFERLKSKLAEK